MQNTREGTKTIMKQRNATIELMRFLFASSIIFFHIAGTLWDRKLILFSGEAFKLTFSGTGTSA